jgi:hypothetical protein
MWLAPIAQLLALSAMAPPAEAASPVSAQALPVRRGHTDCRGHTVCRGHTEPIATRQTFFAIPFRIDPADDPSRQPARVQLFVSGDRGASWQLYSQVDPAQRRFMFRAGADGEFWFLVRTLDRSGQLRPQRPNAPELIVLVDTMPPKLQLQAERGQAGQITTRWQIDDLHAKPNSLILQYRTTADGPWQEVAVDRRTQPASGSPQTGQVTWWPQPGSGKIQIRAEALDQAGNLAVSHAQVELGPDTGGSPLQTARAPSSSWRAAAPGPAVTPWPAEQPVGNVAVEDRGDPTNRQGVLAGNLSGAAPAGPGNVETRAPAGDGGSTGYGFDRPANDRYANYRYPDMGASQSTSAGAGTRATSSLDRRAALYPPPQPSTLNGNSPKDGLLAGTVNPPIQNQYVAPVDSHHSAFDLGLPPGQRPRMVNSREFQLEYDVTSVGPSGIARVELWATQDGGRSWRKLAQDDDRRSPLTVKVDQEGVYGLKVVVTSGTGLGGGRPLSGELPEIVVGVDLTKPSAQITAARQGAGAESGNLIICWQADDQRLAAGPVSLSFSEQPGGPWTTIASGLENSGRHVWAIGYRAPPRIYLRLEVRDEAGNLGVVEKPGPVSLGRFRPTAQIRDVRPPEDAARTPASRYYLQ